MIREIKLQTRERYQLVDITSKVEELVKKSGIEEGICLVFVPHSTAGILLTENEEGLKKDWLKFLKKLVEGLKFEHNLIDNNADSHLLAGLLGQGRVLPIEKGKLTRGTWQEILLVEFDGPRERKVKIRLAT